MAKRKTVQERDFENAIKKTLNTLGEKISTTAAKNSKVRTGDLRDSENYRVRPYNVLTVSENYYGKYNTPKGQPTPKNRSNLENTPLKNAIKEHVNDETKVIIKDMIDIFRSSIITNK